MSLRESIFSIGSRMMIHRPDDEIDFDVMTLEELQEMQDNLLQKIWMLTIENDVYERYLTRIDPQSVKTITSLLERARYTRRVTARMISRSSRMSFRESVMSLHDVGRPSVTSTTSVTSMRSMSRFATPSLLTVATQSDAAKITMAHRMVIAKKEVEELKKKQEQFKKTAKKRKATMRGEVEEIEIRINEAYEAKEDFEEEVVVKGVDPITGKIPAERVIRFVEEWLRSANAIIEKLRLKSATVRMRIRKARRQLVQRKELGETLHSVDFEKLNIENQDFVKMLEGKSLYVIDMKRIAGHYHLKLTQHKQKLNDLLFTLNDLKKEILSKRSQMEELDGERAVVEVRLKRMSRELSSLLNFMDNYVAPDVLEFVQLHEEYAELQRAYKLLQRRRNIDKIIYEDYQKQLQSRKKSRFSELSSDKHKEPKKTSDTKDTKVTGGTRGCNYICKRITQSPIPSLLMPPYNWSYGACLEDGEKPGSNCPLSITLVLSLKYTLLIGILSNTRILL